MKGNFKAVLQDFCRCISRRISSSNALEPAPGKVTLETIHRFKGMEAGVVILTGLEGMHPSTAKTLLYVGITRAKGHLVVIERGEVLAQWGLGG